MTALELAEAAVLADATVALCLIGWLLPIGAVLIAFGVVPMAALAARHRLRTVLCAGVAALVASLLVAGTGLAVNTAAAAGLGMVVGVAIRRGWGVRRTVLGAVGLLGVPGAAVAVLVLAVLSHLRRLALVQVTHTWHGVSNILKQLGFSDIARTSNDAVDALVRNWALAIVAALLVAVAGATWIAYGLALPTLRRLAVTSPVIPAMPSDDGQAAPVELREVSFRYPGAARDALSRVSMRLDPGEMVAIVGPNGSGKSTLGRILAGTRPTAGSVTRTDGGSALIFQRPETQVLGVTAADDVLWGVHADGVDVGGLLARVGLAGFDTRETATLSGGELQRLALAAALARAPRLLVADEVTAMVDPDGRRELVSLMRSVADAGTAVAFITHRTEEAAHADRIVRVGAAAARAAEPDARPTMAAGRDPLISLRGVGHVYGRGSPWAHRALTDVDLDLLAGEGVVIVGRNGSGKSTLAWVLTGLLIPSEGEALLLGRPIDMQIGQVGLAFQHARLQLLRETVASDVIAASGASPVAAAEALDLVGLDPSVFGPRYVDQLSGGEQRRVALAGLLAARPRLLVLDEPFAGLDTGGVAGLTDVLARLRRDSDLTLVVVSHDAETLAPVTDRRIALERGRVAGAPPAKPAVPNRRARDELRLLRPLPGTSPIHRLWAGTKLLALIAMGVTLSVAPTWRAIGIVTAVLAAAVLLARIRPGALPRVPRWFWIAFAASFVLSTVGGGWSAIGDWGRATVLAAIALGAAAVVSWTTPPAAVAPALQRLGRPLKWLRLPIDEWAIAIGLSFRCLPLLIDEVRTLAAVRRLRDAHRHDRPRHWRHRLAEPQEFLTAALTVALRRANEFAAAIDARGGLGAFSADRTRPGRRDLVAGLVVAGAVALAVTG